MSKLTIIHGPAGSGKTARIMGQIAAAVERREGNQLLLVPEQYSHEAEKELCRFCGDSLSLYGQVITFTRLAARVEDELGVHSPTMDKGGRLLAMKLALSGLGGRLQVYGAALRRPELMQALAQLVTELKSAMVDAAALEELARTEQGVLGEKLQDLSLILAAFDAVAAQGKADPADRLRLLSDRLPQSGIGAGGHVYIDGFSDFSAQEYAVIAALMDKGGPMTICLTCDGLERGSEIFTAPRQTGARLRAMAQERGWEVELCPVRAAAGQDAPALAFLEKHLFSYTREHCDDRENAVRLYAAPDLLSECELAAARCVELVRTTGCRWRDIAVTVRGFEHYSVFLESVFAHYGVPLYISARSNIQEKPLPALLSAAFEVVEGGWDCEAVLAYCKTGLAGAEPWELDALENYALQWDIHGGAWTRDEDWTLSPEGFAAEESERARAELCRLDSQRRRLCAPLHRYEKRSAQVHSAAAQAKVFAVYLEDLHLAEKLSRRAQALREQQRYAQAMEYTQLWEILVSALEQFHAVLGEDTPMEREEFGRLLTAMLSQYDVGTIPASLDAVAAGEMDRMRRRHLKHLIVLGATDAALPAPESQDALLTGEEREQLCALGIRLRSPRNEDLFKEMELIYNCLSLPSESLLMSYPVAGGENGDNRPSVILARLAALTGKQPRSFHREEAMLSAAAPALELAARNQGPASRAARAYFRQRPDYAQRLERLSAAELAGQGRLSAEGVQALYGQTPRLSATRAERFAQCGFAYFMQYGLAAKPRRKAGFDPPELGKFMHYVLEHVTRDVQAEGGFAQLRPERRDQLADLYVEKYIHEKLCDFRDKSERFIYLFRRLTRTVRRVVAEMAAELAVSDFVPLDFELDVSGMTGDLTDGENRVAVTGIVDRVDGWLHEGKLYLRVVDYKTGKKSFSLSDVWYGMGLQMLMYLFTLEKAGAAHYGTEIVPAGVLYAPARDVLVQTTGAVTDAEILEKRAKKLQRSGLVLNDPDCLQAMEHGDAPQYIPVKFNKDGQAAGDSLASREQLGLLARHIEKTLLGLVAELRAGQIDVSPAFRSSTDNACQWCEYSQACRFDESLHRRRWQSKLRPAQVWENLQQTREEVQP